ncbi:GatB/YqeY domain-containing protein [bacterium]|nr:MAG: GatB/YqeY domain-containing protein [bacterium]
MRLDQTLETDLLEAMKARDEIRVQVLRLVKAALKNQEIEVKGDLTPQQMLAVLQKEAKKRHDSITQYEAAGRDDLVRQERAELEILDEYLPDQVSTEEMREAVRQAITDADDNSATMGQVIAQVREKFSGAVDGAALAAMVREELQKSS